MQLFLFDNPWPIGGTLVLAGAVLLLQFARSRSRRGMISGLIILALGGSVFGMASWVVTPRERISAQTRQVVHATAPLDMATLRELVAPSAVVLDPDGELRVDGERMWREMQEAIEHMKIREQSIRDLVVQMEGEDVAHSHVDLRTAMSVGPYDGLPVASKWRLTWRRGDDAQWRVTHIQLVEAPMGRGPR